MIAYNLQNWFQTVILPEEYKTKEIKTIRRIFYKVAGIISGNYRYRHIKFSTNKILEKILNYVRNSLIKFNPSFL